MLQVHSALMEVNEGLPLVDSHARQVHAIIGPH